MKSPFQKTGLEFFNIFLYNFLVMTVRVLI